MNPCKQAFRLNLWMRYRTSCWAIVCVLILCTAGSAQSTSELFVKHCAPCHGKDGKAQNPAARKLGVKDLSLSKATDAEIIKQVTEGRRDERGSLKMPSFKENLTTEEIQALVTVVKSFRK